MPVMTVYKEDLERTKCACPDCDEPGVFLASKCHLESPLWAKYLIDEQVLLFTCAACDREVIKVAVASSK